MQCNAIQPDANQSSYIECNVMQCCSHLRSRAFAILVYAITFYPMQCNLTWCNSICCNAIKCNVTHISGCAHCNLCLCNAMHWNAKQCNSTRHILIQLNVRVLTSQVTSIAITLNSMQPYSMQLNVIQPDTIRSHTMPIKCNTHKFKSFRFVSVTFNCIIWDRIVSG